ncbi:oxidoreductase [Novosphingobium guangzhouense]|uniref:Short-chain dehydrogenase/reductase n=1 Tax=Novosphingobium guangzhouense TaxID=1850347 RepID=A0A2K2G6U3_9SPHN|nr:oxidoreductase [Novosphingobium guangzhouense]PNU06739.1 short-chain dehydrogenase/reductase [Novosphingobium guangzhouense]
MSTWFITGVSTGLGRAIAQVALEAGHTVVGTLRDPAAVVAFETLGERAVGVVLDVTDAQAVKATVDAAEARTGGLDVIVNNAGLGYTGAIEETPIDDAKTLFDVNVWGPLAVIQAALPHLRARRAGHIVNVGSISGMACWNGTGIYGASKFALDCIGRTLAQEVGPLGIKVTNVAPGGMRTEFAASRLLGAEPRISDYAGTAHMARQVLTGHHGEEPSDPVKVAHAVLEAVSSPHPPLVLLLGTDAQGYARHEFAMLQAQFDDWQHLTTGVAAQQGGAQ